VSGFVAAGTRPLRIYGWVLLVASLGFLVAAAVCAVSITRTGTTVLAQGRPGAAIELSTAKASGGLKVLAARPGDAATTTADSCRLSGNHPTSILTSAYSLSTYRYAGQAYRPFVSIGSGWQDGDTITCTGPHLSELLVVHQDRTSRIVLTALLAFVALGSGVLGIVGITLRRNGS
jgi:hypothetical protein